MAVNLDMHIHREPPNYLNVDRMKNKSSPSPDGDAQYRGALRLAGVCVGLLCIIQATLNVVLRLYLTSQADVGLLPVTCDNSTLCTDTMQLQSRYNTVLKEKRQLESNYISLGKVRDELRKTLSTITEDLRKPEWIFFKSSIYYRSTEKKDWTQSQLDCVNRGANLVIIKSKEEQDFIEMLRRGRSTWIGLTDMVQEGVWKWVDNTPLTLDFWLNNEPNNLRGSENCVASGYTTSPEEISGTGSLNTWNDASCSLKNFWICEKTIPIKV